MTTPFDEVVLQIEKRGYHNHRLEDHSAAVSTGIVRDLAAMCDTFDKDLECRFIRQWQDFPSPGGRSRKLDLVVAEPKLHEDMPDLARLRLCIENKSVITAHRNRTNRYDDLSDVVGVLHRMKPDAVLVATVFVGIAERVLNVPDRVRPFLSEDEFAERVLPRLCRGDESLWKEFPHAISRNRPQDPERTVAKFRSLPTRPPGRTDLVAFDYVLLIPVYVDNVNPPRLVRDNALGIDIDAEYQAMLDRLCRAYTARWHL